MRAVLDIVLIVLDLYVWLLIASAILSWLIAFNVVNTRNQFVAAVAEFLYRITEPVLAPIRNFLPNLGGLDISPIILILIIMFIQRVIIYYIYPNVILIAGCDGGFSMEPWRYSSDGISVSLRVTPRGGRDDIDGIETLANGRNVVKVRVRAIAEGGEANRAVTELAGESARRAQGQRSGVVGRDLADEADRHRRRSRAARRSLAATLTAAKRRIEMTAQIIDGKAIAAELRARVAGEVARVKRDHGLVPGLAVVLVGHDPGQRSLCPQQAQADPGSRHGLLRAQAAGRRLAESDLLALIAKPQPRPGGARYPGAAAAAEIAAYRDHHQRHRSRQGRRRSASEQCRPARRRLCGAVALHAARLHHPEPRACMPRSRA